MPNLTVGFFGLFCATPVVATTLHYGGQSIRLDTVRRTSPALVIGMTGGTQYGALYTENAPAGALHIGNHWLAQNCAPGTYSPDGLAACVDCGLGHYCTGGMHRAACSGGIIACSGTTAIADAAAPAFANRLLSLDEVNTNVPETSMAQWKKISCCSQKVSDEYFTELFNDLGLVNQVSGCANGVLEPGTYLFVQNAGSVCSSSTETGFSSYIAVFNHAVSYRSIHASDVFYNFIDIDGPDFTEWDIRVSPRFYCTTAINTNISDMNTTTRGFSLCIYELQ